jgi:hypothetical protein
MIERLLCDYCDREIQDDHYYLINDDVICQECLDGCFRKELDDEQD